MWGYVHWIEIVACTMLGPVLVGPILWKAMRWRGKRSFQGEKDIKFPRRRRGVSELWT